VGTPPKMISLREAKPFLRTLTVPLSMGPQILVISEDEGRNMFVSSGIIREEFGTKNYYVNTDCTDPKVSIQREIFFQKLSPLALKTLDPNSPHIDPSSLEMNVHITTNSEMTSNDLSFNLKDHLQITLNNELFFERSWEKQINRNFV